MVDVPPPAGVIPPELGGLKLLTYLGLHKNKLSGMSVVPRPPCFFVAFRGPVHLSRLMMRSVLISCPRSLFPDRLSGL